MSKPDKITPESAVPLFPALGAPESFVFIFAVGFAGDLFVQRLLNAQPGVCIRGENGDVLGKIMQAWLDAEARTHQQMHVPGADVAELLRGLDVFGRQLAAAFAEAVLVPPAGVRFSGFREVRYVLPEVPIADQLRFLYAFFPGARFVFCLRDAAAIAQTGWWRDRPEDDLVERLAEAQAALRSGATEWQSRSCVVQLEEVVRAPESLESLFRLLDLPFDRERVEVLVNQIDLDNPEEQW